MTGAIQAGLVGPIMSNRETSRPGRIAWAVTV